MSPPEHFDTERIALVTRSPGETRIALIEDGSVVDIHHFRDHEARPGDLFLGRVGGRVPGIAAVFVSVGGSAGRDGFLAAEDGPDPLPPEGSALIVEVTHAARPGKGPKLSAKPSLAGAFVAYTPARPGIAVSAKIAHKTERRRLTEWAEGAATADEGLIVRTAAFEQPEAALDADLTRLRRAWHDVTARATGVKAPALLRPGQPPLSVALAGRRADRILCDTAALAEQCREARPDLADRVRTARSGGGDLFQEEGVEDAIDGALAIRVPLPGGGALSIEETAALTAIDIDSGSASSGSANSAATAEIARQIRLRNLGGQIVIDIADPPAGAAAARRAFADALAARVAADPVPTRVIGISPLGLIEVRRDRRGQTLAARLLTPRAASISAESVALAALRQVESAARSQPGLRPGISVAPAVHALLTGPLAGARQEIESRLGRPLKIDSSPAFAPDHIALFDTGRNKP